VLIWNSIPTQNQQAADLVLGQPDMVTATSNNSSALCASNGTDDDGNPTYPDRCKATLSFPRFALTDGQRLFIADGGNDRVLVYSTLRRTTAPRPTSSSATSTKRCTRSPTAPKSSAAPVQSLRPPGHASTAPTSTSPIRSTAASWSSRTGTLSSPPPASAKLPPRGIAVGSIAFTGTITAGDEVTTPSPARTRVGAEIKHD
jgi:hypothetical protein